MLSITMVFKYTTKHENFIFGSDNIITNPLKGQGVLSSKEEELVEG